MWRDLFTHRTKHEEEGAAVSSAQNVARLLYLAALLSLASGPLLLYAYRLPSIHVIAGSFAYVLLAITLVALLPGLIALAMAFATGGPVAVRAHPVLWALRLLGPVVLLVCWLLVRLDVPRKVMFSWNRSALTAFATSYAANRLPDDASATVGSYRLEHIHSAPGGFRAFVANAGFFRTQSGLAYSPQGEPTVPTVDATTNTFEPLGEGWYYWHHDG